MKSLCLTGAAVFAMVLAFAVPAQAGHHGGCDCCAADCECPPPCPEYKYKTMYEIKFVPKEVTKVVEVKVPKEVVTCEKVCEKVPVWKEEKKCVTTYKKVPRECEKEVVSCHMVAECVTDPCTGCTKTCYKPVTCIKKEKYTVYDCVPETKEVIEKVCHYETREKIIQHKCTVMECHEECVKEKITLVTLSAFEVKQEVKPKCWVPTPYCPPASCGCSTGCGH